MEAKAKAKKKKGLAASELAPAPPVPRNRLRDQNGVRPSARWRGVGALSRPSRSPQFRPALAWSRGRHLDCDCRGCGHSPKVPCFQLAHPVASGRDVKTGVAAVGSAGSRLSSKFKSHRSYAQPASFSGESLETAHL